MVAGGVMAGLLMVRFVDGEGCAGGGCAGGAVLVGVVLAGLCW
ncbi:hypothetical protein [Bartonella sp. MU70NMGDW]